MRHGAPSLARRFVAGFLLLRSTFKRVADLWAQRTPHNEQQLLRRGRCRAYGLRKTAVAGCKQPSLCGFSPPHFLCAGIASQFLHRAQKTSVALLLCAIGVQGIFIAAVLGGVGGWIK
jgi:hypothetical protein